MPSERDIAWTGEPLLYPRPSGHGLVVGRYLYTFDRDGRMEAMQPVTRPVLQLLLGSLYKEPALAMAARVRPVQDAPVPAPEAKEKEEAGK